jgi:ABC-type nickel/cobalt efflux system permease component RcnA
LPRSLRVPAVAALATAIAVIAAMTAIGPAPAAAHPLGNFTINHYTRIDVSSAGIELYRVLDMAEIPTVQERQRIDTNDDGALDESETAAFASSKADDLAREMTLRVNGETVHLSALSTQLTFPEGQGGLSTLRLAVTYRAELGDRWLDATPQVDFEDRNYDGRQGWREVVVRGGPGAEVLDSTAPPAGISSELLSYPEGTLSSPLDVRGASFNVRPGAGAPLVESHPGETEAVRGNPDGVLSRFSDLIAKDELTPGVIAIALLAAVAFGAYHALTPGHGKTIVAAYLIGSRGTAWHALLLGLVVTATHTSTVYVVGFVALYLSQYIVPEDLYPWLGLASGALIFVMGIALLISRLRATSLLRHARDHHGDGPHNHTEHSDDHAAGGAPHSHGFGSAHSHRIPGQDGEPVTIRSLVGLGVFGGMIPCPSAIVVMLSAIALHRVAFGLVLIVAFSVGLAGVLVAIGFALVFARSIGDRVPPLAAISARIERGGAIARLARAVPVAAAGGVVAAGVVITLRAMAQGGWV